MTASTITAINMINIVTRAAEKAVMMELVLSETPGGISSVHSL